MVNWLRRSHHCKNLSETWLDFHGLKFLGIIAGSATFAIPPGRGAQYGMPILLQVSVLSGAEDLFEPQDL